VIDELKPINMIYKKNNSIEFEKHGVKMRLYTSKEQCPEAAIVYQETNVFAPKIVGQKR
jgi:hypothetical protein